MQDARRQVHGAADPGKAWRGILAAQTPHGLRSAEMEQMRKLVRELRAGAKRLVELT